MPNVTFAAEVVGIEHRMAQSTIRMLSKHIDTEGVIAVKLQREPDNEYDENAIKVVIAEGKFKLFHVGYLRRQVAEVYAPSIDAGRVHFSNAWLVGIDPDSKVTLLTVEVRKGKAKR